MSSWHLKNHISSHDSILQLDIHISKSLNSIYKDYIQERELKKYEIKD